MNLHSPESGLRHRAQAMTQPPPVQQVYSYKYPPPISGIPVGIVFILGFMITLTGVVMAQTEWKDRYVSIARNHQLNPSIAYPTQAGATVTVWEDERDVKLTGSDIYIQSIDNGTGVSQWVGPNAYVPGLGFADIVTDRFDGIAVCKAEFNQRNPRAAYDGMGGVIAGLLHRRIRWRMASAWPSTRSLIRSIRNSIPTTFSRSIFWDN